MRFALSLRSQNKRMMLTCTYLTSSTYHKIFNYLLDRAFTCRTKMHSKAKAQELQATRESHEGTSNDGEAD